MLPVAFWTALFYACLPFAFYKALREPIYAALAAAYLYFAIPNQEFNPNDFRPYAALFWAIAAASSFRYNAMLRKRARDEIDEAGLYTAKLAVDSLKKDLIEAQVLAAMRSAQIGELRAAGLATARERALKLADATAPSPILAAVRRAIERILEEAAAAGEAEALKVVENAGKATKGNLRAALDARVGPVVEESLAKITERITSEELNRAVEEGEKDATRPPNLGALGIPLPRGPLTGLLSNPGLWIHVVFTILTYYDAQNAQFSVYKAMAKFDTCVLLFIPMVAIICAVRDPRHVRLFVIAWMFGTMHLCMNAITWWLQNGGRADNPGGQGGESNFLGAIISTIAPVSFGMILNSKRWLSRGVSIALAGIFVLGILASGSRAALIALVASSGYWLLHTNKKGFATGGVMIAAACFLAVAPDDFWDRMGTILGPKDRNPWVQNEVEPSKHERQVLWALAIEIYEANPLMGIGPGQYNYVSAEKTDFTDPYQQQRGLQTHNTWLQLAAEYGIVGTSVWGGAFLLSLLCYTFARRRIRKYKGWEWYASMCLGLEAGAIGNAICCTFNSFQWYDYHYWHFIFGPLVYQVAKEAAERIEWMKPIDLLEPHPPPRYGPPVAEGLDVGAIDLSGLDPVGSAEPSAGV